MKSRDETAVSTKQESAEKLEIFFEEARTVRPTRSRRKHDQARRNGFMKWPLVVVFSLVVLVGVAMVCSGLGDEIADALSVGRGIR